MAESSETDLTQLLPDEMLFEVFGHFDGLSDRDTLSKVNRRFNRLAKFGGWRKNLKITGEDCMAHRRLTLEGRESQLTKEIKMIDCLESIIIDPIHMQCSHNDGYGCDECIIDPALNVIEILTSVLKQCKTIGNMEFGGFYPRNLKQLYVKNGLMKCDLGTIRSPELSHKLQDMFAIFPFPLKYIFVDNKFASINEVLKVSINSLEKFKSTCDCLLDMNSFQTLLLCTKLESISFTDLRCSDACGSRAVPKMSPKELKMHTYLGFGSSLTHRAFLTSFFSENLATLSIRLALLIGNEDILFASCPNLVSLTIEDHHLFPPTPGMGAFINKILICCKKLNKIEEINIGYRAVPDIDNFFKEINFQLEDYFCYLEDEYITFERNYDGYVFVCYSLDELESVTTSCIG